MHQQSPLSNDVAQNILNEMRKMSARLEALESHSSTDPPKQPNGISAQAMHPKDPTNSHTANAVVTRSGKEFGETLVPLDFDPKRKRDDLYGDGESPRFPSTKREDPKKGKRDDEVVEKPVEEVIDEAPSTKEASMESRMKKFETPLPFPSRARQAKGNEKFEKFMEILKKYEVSIPFVDLVTQIPTYTKFLKDVLAKKRNIENVERISLGEECSAAILNMPIKLKDPGSFSISCSIGNISINRALADLGASVSLLPLSIANRLGLGSPSPTKITLQLADGSIKHPVGILEDIPVKVGKFYIPADFVILDMPEDHFTCIILGRPFLATGGVIIDVKKGKLSFNVGDDEITFCLPAMIMSPMVEEIAYVESNEENFPTIQGEEVQDENGGGDPQEKEEEVVRILKSTSRWRKKAKVKEKKKSRKRSKRSNQVVKVIEGVYSLFSVLKEMMAPKNTMRNKHNQGRGVVLSHGHPWGDPG